MRKDRRGDESVRKRLPLLDNSIFHERWMAAETIVASLFFILGEEVAGVVFFVYWISFKLILSDDPLAAFLPFLLIGLIVLRLYDSFDLFMSLRFVLGVPAVTSLLFHFLYYRKAPHRGGLTAGYLAVALALALGGLGSLPIGDYLSGTSLYYTYGLGFGLLLVYSLLVRGVCPRAEYDLAEYVAKVAFYVGLLAVFIIAYQYLAHLAEIAEGGWAFSERRLSSISNNLSTTVMLTMPFLFYLSCKGGARGGVYFVVGVLEGLAAVLSLSRGGMIFASATCLFLILYTLVTDGAGRRRNLVLLSLILLFSALTVLCCRDTFAVLYGEGIKDSGETVRLLFVLLSILAFAVTAYAFRLFRMRDGRRLRAHLAILVVLSLLGVTLFVLTFDQLKPLLVRADYYRGNMMIIAADNFRRYPFFGTGMGYRGLRAVYPNRKGMFGCYHCLPVQVIGSMGLVGAAAYLYMFRARVRLLRKGGGDPFAAAVFLSYLGLLWISLTEPGIFCPVVYGIQLSLYFIAVERRGENTDISEK